MRLTGFWWWIDRWRKSTAYTDMTLEQQGAYRNLLDEGALRGGPLPNDERILAKACGDALKWKKIRDVVMAKFTLRPEGWRNETLDEVLDESKRRAEKQRRYRNKSGNEHGNERGNEHGNDLSNETGNNTRPPDPDPVVRTYEDSETHTRAREPSAVGNPVLAERAGTFVHRYGELFAEHRKGARYHSKPSVDFQEAVGLCQTWDDARLEILAVAFLTTDEKFCREGTGSIAQFRSRASWCDARLRTRGL